MEVYKSEKSVDNRPYVVFKRWSAHSQKTTHLQRPAIVRTHSDPTPASTDHLEQNEGVDEYTSGESRDTIQEPNYKRMSRSTTLRHSASRPNSMYRTSFESSRPNSLIASISRPSMLTSTTSGSGFTIDTTIDASGLKTPESQKRPSLLDRLRSSMSTSSSLQTVSHTKHRPCIPLSDFRLPPESPEKHFIDSIGMCIPGVDNRNQCAHPLAHLVTVWRLCEPIEYTTSLADHKITYTDYRRLLDALAGFLDHAMNEQRRNSRSPARKWSESREGVDDQAGIWNKNMRSSVRSGMQSTEQHKRAQKQAECLNKLLEEVSSSWQSRGMPVMVCIGSFSLFSPNRISESHVQILHVSLEPRSPADQKALLDKVDEISFVDSAVHRRTSETKTVSGPRRRPKSILAPKAATAPNAHHYQQSSLRDRSCPWPLWPNAIPSRKRKMMSGHAERYGFDPYFRGWVRANINSKTTCTSYCKYMIENEDNPFVNKRLAYVAPLSRIGMLRSRLKGGYTNKEQVPSTANRAYYEHNRKLECRKSVEHSSRLRLVSFGFRRPLYPPHTPEMEELGLTKQMYQDILSRIEDIRRNCQSHQQDCHPYLFASWRKLRHRSAEDALTKVSEYIRQINASQRRVVWTIERIPGVYDRGFGRDKKEWEISAWNGEDPLELLIQLERWGLIERRLELDNDDD